MRCAAARASNGPDHLGLCALQVKHTATFWTALHCIKNTTQGDCDRFSDDIPEGSGFLTGNGLLLKWCNFQCDHIIGAVSDTGMEMTFYRFLIIVVLWLPTFIVYFVDAQIFFGLYQMVVGLVVGVWRRIASIRTFDGEHGPSLVAPGGGPPPSQRSQSQCADTARPFLRQPSVVARPSPVRRRPQRSGCSSRRSSRASSGR